MGILWAQDIRSKIVTQLQDATYGIVPQLTTIDTARGTTTPTPVTYDPISDEGQFPSVFVDLGDSLPEPTRGASAKDIREEIDLQVMIILKYGDASVLRTYGENYIQAILECLQNYSLNDTTGSFFMVAVKCIRADLDQMEGMTTRGVAVLFKVYRNMY